MKRSVQNLALAGLFAALAVVLSFLESLLPPLPVAGLRLGLANVAVVAAIAITGAYSGIGVALVKVLFVLMTRGATAALLSVSGTLPAVVVMLCLFPLVRRERLSFVGVSVVAAVCHTLGQLVCASVLLSEAVWTLVSLMMLVSTASGTLTGVLLNMMISRLPQPLMRKDG